VLLPVSPSSLPLHVYHAVLHFVGSGTGWLLYLVSVWSPYIYCLSVLPIPELILPLYDLLGDIHWRAFLHPELDILSPTSQTWAPLYHCFHCFLLIHLLELSTCISFF
jgi:hypothetical protein